MLISSPQKRKHHEIYTSPQSNMPVYLPRDLIMKIFENLSIPQLCSLRTICKSWKDMSDEAQIKVINIRKLNLFTIFKHKLFTSPYSYLDYHKVNKNWRDLVRNPHHTKLEYVKLKNELDNTSYQFIVTTFTNLKTLCIESSRLSSIDLRDFPCLTALDISRTDAHPVWQTYPIESIDHLAKGTRLKSLRLVGCPFTEFILPVEILPSLQHIWVDKLKQIPPCPNLESLYVKGDAFSPESLQHPKLKNLTIEHTDARIWDFASITGLETLSIVCADYLESLEFLRFLPYLKSLSIKDCYQLFESSLSNLIHVPALTRLAVVRCYNLEPHSMQNLKYVTCLEKLEINDKRFFASEGSNNLEFVTRLKVLKVSSDFIRQVKRENLRHISQLEDLDISDIKDSVSSLDFLQHFTSLTKLNLEGQRNIISLQPLEFVSQLIELNMNCCRMATAYSNHTSRFPVLPILQTLHTIDFLDSKSLLTALGSFPSLKYLFVGDNTNVYLHARISEIPAQIEEIR